MAYSIQAMRFNRRGQFWEPCDDDVRGARFDVLRDGRVDFMNLKTRAEAEQLVRELES